MKDEEDQFYSEPEELEDIIPLKQQHDALPPKPPSEAEKKPLLKHVEIVRQPQFLLYRPFKLEKRQDGYDDEDVEEGMCDSPFTQFYSGEQCVYLRHNNRSFNRLQGKRYYSGQFANRNLFSDCQSCTETCQISQVLNEYYDVPAPQVPRLQEGGLRFDSRFQSGNLFAAFQVSQYEYDLTMSNDTNSTGSNQWFFFSVQGMEQNRQYTFSVINFTKSDALFNYGMKPVVYSMAENKQVYDVEKGWRRTGSQVSYKRGLLPRQYSNRMYYRLTFKIKASYGKDKLYVAHSYPYTFEKLQAYLLEKKQKNKQFVTKIQIGKALSKRPIVGLTIHFPINKKRDNRKAIIIMARQHPGETQGSYVCEGVVDKLLSRSKETQMMLKNYVFYVIPMVNPDGVVFGHYRTNLAGKDLNRKWNCTEKDYNCPQVTAIKSFLSELSQTRQIRFILDLHGHSRKLNSFFYGNPYQQSPQVVRIFPFICSKLHSGVQYYDCTFTTEQYKRKAARVYLSYLYKLAHVYTFESSFYAYDKEGKRVQFSPKEYRELGGTLISALHLQLEHQVKFQESFQFNRKNIGKDYQSSVFVKYLMDLRNNKFLLEQGNALQSGSDSKPEDGEINNEELQYIKVPKDKQSCLGSGQYQSKVPQVKQQPFSRPTRNLRLLELSKINSFLPEKQFFCLQPIKKETPEPQPKIKYLKESSYCQTQPYDMESQVNIFSPKQIENANLSFSFVPDSMEKKSHSMIKSLHVKNNIIFRVDNIPNKTEREHVQPTEVRRKKPSNKNALSQTIQTFMKKQGKKERRVEHLPEIELADRQTEPLCLRSAQIKLEAPLNSMFLKKDAEGYFNNMIKRFLENKERNKSYETSNRSVLDKSFNIKRRQSNRR